MAGEPLVVIGIGHDGPAGLSQEALAHIQHAKVLAGGKRHLAFFPDWPGETLRIDADLEGVMQQLTDAYRRAKTVVLASGDPLFYGIGHLLSERIPRDDLVFLPQVSSVQLAFARLATSWHNARVVSLHGRPLHTLLPALRQGESKIALFTDATNHPAAIARLLVDHGYDDYTIWVCEELGGANERVTQWTPHTILTQSFSPLNVTILLRCAAPAGAADKPVPLIGIPESALAHRAGMISKREVRLIALCYLSLRPGDVLWDIGAGSGSVSLEAARLCPALEVFAIERAEPAYRQICANLDTFALANVHPVLGEAPEALAALPAPHAVFMGGSGGRFAEIISTVVQRLQPGGRMVINCITLEHFTAGWQLLGAQQGLRVEATSVQLAHAAPLGTLHRFESESPLFILQAHKA